VYCVFAFLTQLQIDVSFGRTHMLQLPQPQQKSAPTYDFEVFGAIITDI
jgi:hypothetical protein